MFIFVAAPVVCEWRCVEMFIIVLESFHAASGFKKLILEKEDYL